MDKELLSTNCFNEFEDTTIQQQTLAFQSNSNKFNCLSKKLFDLVSKHKFRKTLTEIKKNEDSHHNNPEAMKTISIIKLQCYFLIIKKKHSKYKDITFTNISSWLSRIETELENLSIYFQLINHDKERNAALVEQFVYFYLLYLYNYALFSKKIKLINDTIGYLIIAENSIKSLSCYITYPSTLHLIQLIYLLFSSILVEQEYFSTAINYLLVVLTLGLKELELRSIPDSAELKKTKIDMTEDELIPHIHNNFFTFIVAFLQLGICAESVGNYEQATYSYEQSNWFISFVSDYTSGALVSFIQNLTIKSKQTLELLSVLKSTDFNSNDYTEVKVNKKHHLYFSEDQKLKRYEHIQQYVENLKLTEIDDDEAHLLTEIGSKPPTDTVKQMTATVNFINLLMSNQYKPLVSSINKLEINNLDKETKTKIQKKIINVKNTERLKLFESKIFVNNSCRSNPNLTVNDSNRTKGNGIYLQLNTDISTPITNLRYNTNTNTQISNKIYLNYLSSFSNPKPEKIKYDRYVFNKIYRNKINYLEYQTKKEYLFQKDLLKMKRYDTIPIKIQQSERVINNCEKFYKKTLSNCVQKLKEKQESTKLNQKSIDQEIKKAIFINFQNKKKRNDAIKALVKNFPRIPKSRRTLEYMKQNQHMIDQLEFDIEVLGDKAKKINQKKYNH